MRPGVFRLKTVYQVQDLTKIYRRGSVVANDRISFTVRQGEILAILGPNGAGKSTLVQQMSGHTRPTSGSITLLDCDVMRHPDRIPFLAAYYPQQPLALHHLKVREALVLTGQLRGLPTRDAIAQASDLIEQFGLGGCADHILRSVSGGQKRLTGIGTALIGKLPVLILDEPTNELDPVNRRLVWEMLRSRNERDGVTIIVVTHNVLEAELVVDRVAIIDGGRLLTLDTVGALKRQVDQRMRLEVTVAPHAVDSASAFLAAFGPVRPISDTRLRVTLDRTQLGTVVQAVTDSAAALGVEEYRLVPPSLEDVYLHVGGKEVSVGD